MSPVLMVLLPALAATLAGLIRVVAGTRRLEWGRWDIARAIVADQHLVRVGPVTFAGQQYAALVREIEGHTEGHPVIDTRAGVVDLTRVEHDPSAQLVDDMITRDLRSQLCELRAGVVEGQLCQQATLARCWLVYGDCDVTLLGVTRIERYVVRVVNLEDPAIQLHLTLREVSAGLGIGGERSEIAGLLTGVAAYGVPAAVERMILGRTGLVEPLLRIGLRGTGLIRCRKAPALADRGIRHRVLIADASGPVDQRLVGDIRAHLVESGDRVDKGSWCRIGGPAVAVGLFVRLHATMNVTAESPHWDSVPVDRLGLRRQVPTAR
ncbi:MAG: hypothetical protein GY698_20675 [Actinomycetia bacterium]|nr:hypothetical protein [Actinomycetes bacterium]